MPVLLTAAIPAALRLPRDQTPFAFALESVPDWMTAAAAWKSLVWSDVDPEKPPAWTSTHPLPCVLNGFVPETLVRSSRTVTETIVALSGIAEVSKARMLRYCLSLPSSPIRSVLAFLPVVPMEPPVFDVSLDSRTQPSCAATEVNVTGVSASPGVLDAWFELPPPPSALVPVTT